MLKSASCVLEGWGTKLPVIHPDTVRLINVSFLAGSDRYEGLDRSYPCGLLQESKVGFQLVLSSLG